MEKSRFNKYYKLSKERIEVFEKTIKSLESCCDITKRIIEKLTKISNTYLK